ncbi:LEA type 2 family protein [Chloroflexota bacterium]
MKKWFLIIVSIVVVVCVAAVFVVYSGLNKLQEPELRSVSLEWGQVTSATTEVLGTITVYNPNSVPLPIESVTCNIKLDGIHVGSAETIDLQIEEEAEFPVKIVIEIDNAKIPEFWAEHLRRDEKSEAEIVMRIAFDLEGIEFTLPYTLRQPVETNILSGLSQIEPISVEKKTDIPILGEKTVFKVSLNKLSGAWGTATPQTSQMELIANVYNDNLYPLLIPKIKCIIESNGMPMGSGETGLFNAVLPRSSKDIGIGVTLDTSLMDEWFVRHIQQGEKSSFAIQILMDFELPEQVFEMIGREDLSITLWEGSHEIETDILGSKRK